MTETLPLFPLPLALFPGALQALHIFEPRYRRLLADCLEARQPFGVICVLPGQAEGTLPRGTVGCRARIESAQTLSDGRSNIIVIGDERFSLLEYAESDLPYRVGVVDTFTDEVDVGDPLVVGTLAREVRTVFDRAARATRQMHNDTTPVPELPPDADALSFAMPQYLDIELADRQKLLCMRSTQERLRWLHLLLHSLITTLEARAAVHTGAKRNGHGPHPPPA